MTGLKTKLAKFIVNSNLRVEEMRSDSACAASLVEELRLVDQHSTLLLGRMTLQLAEAQEVLRLAQERVTAGEDEARAAHERLVEELSRAKTLLAQTQLTEEEAARENARLRSELSETKVRLGKMEESVHLAEATAESKQEDERQLQMEVKRLSAELKVAGERLKEREEEERQLKMEMERLSDEKIQQFSELQDIRAQDSQKMAALQEEVATLKNALTQQRDRRDEDSRRLVSRAAQMDAVTAQLVETTEACGKLMEEVRQEEISHCRDRLKWEMKRDASTAAVLHDIAHVIRLLGQETDELRCGWEKDATAVQNQVAGLKSVLANQTDSCSRLVGVKNACKSGLHKLDRQTSDLEDAIASISEHLIAIKEEHRAAMEQKETQMREDILQLRQVLERQQESKLNQMMKTLDEVKKDRDAAQHQSGANEAEVRARNGELELLKQQVRTLQVARDQAQLETEQANQDVERLSSEVLTLETLSQKLVEAVSPVNVSLTLDLDWSAAGEENSAERKVFGKALAEEITAAAATSVGARGGEMPNDCIRITQMSAGSVVVDLEIHRHSLGTGEAGAGAGDDPVSIAADLQQQALDKSSPLFAGAISKNTKSLVVWSKQELLQTMRNLREDLSAEREGLRLAHASIQAHANRLDMANEEISQMTKNLQEAQTEIQSLNTALKSKEAEVEELNKQIAELNTQVGELETQLAGLQAQITERGQQVAQTRAGQGEVITASGVLAERA